MAPQDSSSSSLSAVEIETRVIKEFLDIIILCEIKEHNELTGYDLAVMQREKFGISLSPGTVYMTMYSMERRGLIAGHPNGKKTSYMLTEKGERSLENIKQSSMDLVNFMKRIFPISMPP